MLCFNNQQRSLHCSNVMAYSFMLTLSGVTFSLLSLYDEDDYYNKASKVAVGTMGFFSFLALANSGYNLYKTFTPARILPETINDNNAHQSLLFDLFKSFSTISFTAYHRIFNLPLELTVDNLNAHDNYVISQEEYKQPDTYSTVQAFWPHIYDDYPIDGVSYTSGISSVRN